VLSRFSIPKNVILDLVGQARRGMYDMLRGGSDTAGAMVSRLPGLEQLQLERLYLKPESPAVGRTLDELAVRRSTGVTVLAVQRAEEMTTNPPATFELASGDILVVVGEPMAIDAALALVDPQAPVA
jgi:K+/H+ antiporter YhaU regulatory subunit KhtT